MLSSSLTIHRLITFTIASISLFLETQANKFADAVTTFIFTDAVPLYLAYATTTTTTVALLLQ